MTTTNADKPTKALFDACEAEIAQANADADAEREAYVQRLRAHQDRATAAEKRIRAAIAHISETHQWTQGRGKLGVGKARITTSVNPFGWRHEFSSRPGWEICSLIVDATIGCRSQATWRVERWRDNRTLVGHYCDEHIRPEDLPEMYGGNGDCQCATCAALDNIA